MLRDEETVALLRDSYKITPLTLPHEDEERLLSHREMTPNAPPPPTIVRRRDKGLPDPIENRATYNRMVVRLSEKKKKD